MKKIILIFAVLITVSSCVSSKKYKELDDKYIKMRSENVEGAEKTCYHLGKTKASLRIGFRAWILGKTAPYRPILGNWIWRQQINGPTFGKNLVIPGLKRDLNGLI